VLIEPLDQLFETPAQIERRARERQAEVRGQKHAEGDPPIHRCRLCGWEAPESRFCMRCLAETMVPLDGNTAPGARQARQRMRSRTRSSRAWTSGRKSRSHRV
jgi:hypothetical protein